MTAYPQPPDSVTVDYDRLVKWYANRKLADQLIRERAWDFARAHNIIIDLKALNVEADTIIQRQLREIDRRIYAQQLTEQAWQAELKRNKWHRTAPWITLLGGIGAGFFIARQ